MPESTAHLLARLLYEQYPEIGTTLEEDIQKFMRTGYVYCDKSCMILASLENDYWYVHLAVGHGALPKFFNICPEIRPYVVFARPMRGRRTIKFYNFERMKQLCSC